MSKVLIAIPCMEKVHTKFMQSMLDLRKPEGACYTVVEGTLIYESRNIIAANAINAGFDWVAWFDSDMKIPPFALLQLLESGKEFISGLYFTRRPPIKPVVYKKLWVSGDKESGAENYFNYPANGIFECQAVGFGCCLTSVSLLKRVGDQYGAPFQPLYGVGEDMSFCLRARWIGEKIYCDSRIKCGHMGVQEYNEDYFLRQEKNR